MGDEEDSSTGAEFIRGQTVAHTAASHPQLTSPSTRSQSLGEQTSPTALYPLTFTPSSFQYSSHGVLIYVSMTCTRAVLSAAFHGNSPLSFINHADSPLKRTLSHFWCPKYIDVSLIIRADILWAVPKNKYIMKVSKQQHCLCVSSILKTLI